jgi:hypothetical protein
MGIFSFVWWFVDLSDGLFDPMVGLDSRDAMHCVSTKTVFLKKIIMRYFLFPGCFFFTLIAAAQKTLPDSTMKEFTRLTCECATLMKIDQSVPGKGIQDLGTCINSTVSIYEKNGWIKTEWLNDSVWAENFNNELQAVLFQTCPVFKPLLDKINKPADILKPLSSVDEKYFIAKEYMIQKGLEENVNADNENMRRWSAKNLNAAKIHMVFDIRFIFKDEQDAISYFKANLEELSEGGDLKDNTLNSFGASESKVYGANARMIEAFGDMDIAQYNFVFRVKNVVAKVFVSTTKKTSYEEALVFAKEAIGRIKDVK